MEATEVSRPIHSTCPVITVTSASINSALILDIRWACSEHTCSTTLPEGEAGDCVSPDQAPSTNIADAACLTRSEGSINLLPNGADIGWQIIEGVRHECGHIGSLIPLPGAWRK